MKIDRQTLNAFVDGALGPEDTVDVERFLDEHPEDRAYVDGLKRLDGALARAYAAPLHEPVPEAIHAAIMSAGAGAAVRRPRAARPGFAGLAAAARDALHAAVRTLTRPVPAMALGGAVAAAALIVLAGSGGLSGDPERLLPVGPVAADSTASTALDRLASGETRAFGTAGQFTVVASFAVPGRGYCREFEVLRTARDALEFGLACRATAGWLVVVAETETVEPSTGTAIRPAAGSGADPVGRFLDDAQAGFALNSEAERDARLRGWRK